jgi:hypothetical protein
MLLGHLIVLPVLLELLDDREELLAFTVGKSADLSSNCALKLSTVGECASAAGTGVSLEDQ